MTSSARKEDAEASATAAPSRASLQRVTRVAVLAAVALALSYVETTIPLPLVFPGAKLGLANIAVLVALFAYDARTAVSVAVVKVLAAGFLFGSPVMMAYSLGGTALAVAGMLLLKLVPGVSVVLVSMASAVLHNTGQVLVACAMLGTPAVFVSLPPLALIALVTGALTGVVAAAVLQEQEAGASADAGGFGAADFGTASPRDPSAFGVYRAGGSLAHLLDARAKLVFVLVFFVAAFVADGIVGLGAVLAVAVVAAACSDVGPRCALKWLKPFWGFFLFVAVFDLLFTASGEAVLQVGLVTVTTGGVAFAAESVVRFACMILGTSSLMATTSPDELTQGVGGLLEPLRRLGVQTQNATLALSLTLSFLPVVAGEFAAVKDALDAGEKDDADAAAASDAAAGGASASGKKRRLSAAASSMRAYGLAFAPAFARSLSRADELALELEADPGAYGAAAVGETNPFTAADWVAVGVAVALLVFVVVWR